MAQHRAVAFVKDARLHRDNEVRAHANQIAVECRVMELAER
jgi:hypothetical protein